MRHNGKNVIQQGLLWDRKMVLQSKHKCYKANKATGQKGWLQSKRYGMRQEKTLQNKNHKKNATKQICMPQSEKNAMEQKKLAEQKNMPRKKKDMPWNKKEVVGQKGMLQKKICYGTRTCHRAKRDAVEQNDMTHKNTYQREQNRYATEHKETLRN